MFAIMRVFHNLLRKGILSQTLPTFLLLLDFNPTKQKNKAYLLSQKTIKQCYPHSIAFPQYPFLLYFSLKICRGNAQTTNYRLKISLLIFLVAKLILFSLYIVLFIYIYTYLLQINSCLRSK